jgi:hypothetical protein
VFFGHWIPRCSSLSFDLRYASKTRAEGVDPGFDADYSLLFSHDKVGTMIRSLLVRGLAVMAVVVTYAFSGIGAQVASVVGISALALTTTSTSADAYYRRRYRRRRYYRPYYRRRYYYGY